MSNREWNQDKLERYLKEGRGKGEGSSYIPWILVTDFPSRGRVSRVVGLKTGRIHHLLSDFHAKAFYLLEWENSVLDIREYFPLHNLHETIKDTTNLNFDALKTKKSGIEHIITSTFLLTVKDSNNKISYVARTLKTPNDLEKKYIIEKLALEMRFWDSQNISFKIITPSEVNTAKANNIKWVRSSLYNNKQIGLEKEEIQELELILMDRIYKNQTQIRKLTAHFDSDLNLETGTGLFLLRHLLATKQASLNFNIPIDINMPGTDIEINKFEKEKNKCI